MTSVTLSRRFCGRFVQDRRQCWVPRLTAAIMRRTMFASLQMADVPWLLPPPLHWQIKAVGMIVYILERFVEF